MWEAASDGRYQLCHHRQSPSESSSHILMCLDQIFKDLPDGKTDVGKDFRTILSDRPKTLIRGSRCLVDSALPQSR